MNGPDMHPAAARILAEKRELMRIACATAVRNADEGHPTADPEHEVWARQLLAMNPPLQGPLGTGEPQESNP